jgi:hypothetical protein
MKGCKKKGICSYYKKKTIIILFENKFKSKRYLMEQYPKCYKFYFILNNNNKKNTIKTTQAFRPNRNRLWPKIESKVYIGLQD